MYALAPNLVYSSASAPLLLSPRQSVVKCVPRDCEEACKLESSISLPLRGAIFLEAGRIQAKAARSEKEKSSALARIDQAGKIIRSAPFPEDPHFLKLNADRYHLTRGAALIALGWNKDAISELTLVHTLPEQKRRRAYNDTLQAQAYANKGNYPMAASLAEAGLIAVQGIQSGINVERVSRIYVQLSESSFRNNSEVARLNRVSRHLRVNNRNTGGHVFRNACRNDQETPNMYNCL